MVLGIDIGGTNIKFGIIDDSYNIVKKLSIETPKQKGDIGMISAIISKAQEIYNEIPFDGIGIGSPGRIDSQNGVCIIATNLPYDNTPIVKMFEDEFNMPVTLENDGVCAVCGELYAGAGRKYNNFVMLTIGTGIGGGIIVEGKPYSGITNLAGEFGHMTINYGGPQCMCGNTGCYELYASITALISQTKKKIEQYPNSLLANMGVGQVTGKTAFDAARAGCPVGMEVVDTYIGYLAYGIRNVLKTFDPRAIILGGAISNEGNNLLIPLKEKLQLNNKTKIEISGLENKAGIIGAASKCMRRRRMK